MGGPIALIGRLVGLVPRPARYRTVPFFCPIRASPWNPISIRWRFGWCSRWAFRVRAKCFGGFRDLGFLCRIQEARTDVGEALRLPDLGHGAQVRIDAEAFEDDLLQLDPPRADEAVYGPAGTRLHDLGEPRLRQSRWMPFGADVVRSVAALFVEPVSLVVLGLAIHPGDPCRLLTIHTVESRCQRAQPRVLFGVRGGGGPPPLVRSRIVCLKVHRSGYGANRPLPWISNPDRRMAAMRHAPRPLV